MTKEKPLPAFPDFLIIGAPEAGGDLVKKYLLQNPKIWFPPLDNIVAFHPAFQLERFQIARDVLKGKIPFKSSSLFWLLRYFLQPIPTRKWYGSLFRTKQDDLVKGEFSDEYLTMHVDEVEELHRNLPDCKIILMVRHPIERSYEAIRHKFSDNKKTPFDRLNQRQLLALMNSDWARSHSSYQNALDCWPVFFSLKNVFVGFYDDLLADPQNFMQRVQKFIGIEGSSVIDPKALPKAPKQFPTALLPRLHPFYRQEIEGLANRLNGVPGVWLDAYNYKASHPSTSKPIAQTPQVE